MAAPYPTAEDKLVDELRAQLSSARSVLQTMEKTSVDIANMMTRTRARIRDLERVLEDRA